MRADPVRRLSGGNSRSESNPRSKKGEELALRILVVDDEENICHYLAELFQLEGWEADIAYDGYQGVKMVTDNDYDIIVMDILMPRMTGIDATREIIKRKPESKIIVITGAPYRSQAQEAIDCGAKLFIKKPFSSNVIVEAVKSTYSGEN
jgi:two-component system chemotaxis response regulator CheY